FFQAEDGIRDGHVTGVQTCALPILFRSRKPGSARSVRIHPVTVQPLPAKIRCRWRTEMQAAAAIIAGLSNGSDKCFSMKCSTRRSEERRVGKEWRSRGWPED